MFLLHYGQKKIIKSMTSFLDAELESFETRIEVTQEHERFIEMNE